MKLLLLTISFIVLYSHIFAQAVLKTDTLKVKTLKIVPLPIIGANPTSGWMFGVAPSATWYLGNQTSTSISSALGSVIYTTNNQLISTAKASTYFSGDSWNMFNRYTFFHLISAYLRLGYGTTISQANCRC